MIANITDLGDGDPSLTHATQGLFIFSGFATALFFSTCYFVFVGVFPFFICCIVYGIILSVIDF